MRSGIHSVWNEKVALGIDQAVFVRYAVRGGGI